MCRFRPLLRPLQGVHLLAIGNHLEVEVCAVGASAAPGAADDLSRLELVAGRDQGGRQVPVAGLYSIRVLDDYRVAVPSLVAAEDDAAGAGRLDVFAVGRAYVDAPMELGLTRERIASPPELRGHLASGVDGNSSRAGGNSCRLTRNSCRLRGNSCRLGGNSCRLDGDCSGVDGKMVR